MVTNDNVRRIRRLDGPEVEHATPAEEHLRGLRRTFPARALGVARHADTSTPAIAQLEAWSAGRHDGIAVVAGPIGTGKTVAAAWLALQQAGGSAPTFLRAAEFAASSRYDAEARARWRDSTWLALDDLGAEYSDAKGSFRTDLDELVDVFYAERRTLIITTNLTTADFRSRYGERIVDRLKECGSWLTIAGRSLRTPTPGGEKP